MNALLGGLDRLIAKKRDLKQAALQQLLTGETRLYGFSGESGMKRLGALRRYLTQIEAHILEQAGVRFEARAAPGALRVVV